MDLFYADRISTQLIAEISEQSVQVLPYEEDAEYYQWVFEICRIEPTVRQTLSSFALLDAFLASMKLGIHETSEPHLQEVDQEEARKILACILSQSLAYQNATGLTEPQIRAIIDQFLRLFPTQPHYFTNAEFAPNLFYLTSPSPIYPMSSHPITFHTFDTGLLLLDEQRIGILWATDED